jgi:hypothetical protein
MDTFRVIKTPTGSDWEWRLIRDNGRGAQGLLGPVYPTEEEASQAAERLTALELTKG